MTIWPMTCLTPVLSPDHKVKLKIINFILGSSQLARLSLAELVFKLIFIELNFACDWDPGGLDSLCMS